MDLLVMPVPFFDKNMAVSAYFMLYQEENALLRANQTEREHDSAAISPLLVTLGKVGIDAFTMGLPIFVPVGGLTLLANLAGQCKVPPEKVVFVLGEDVLPEQPYIGKVQELKKLGFKFAMRGIKRVDTYAPLAKECEYICFSHKSAHNIQQQLMNALVRRDFKNLKIVMNDIQSQADYEDLKGQGVAMFEGRFYRLPITKDAEHNVSPLKVNLIKLLDLVRDEKFEFADVAKVIQQDTALTISLMRLINSPFIGLRQKVTSINQAVTILGQVEVSKWVTTAVSKLLGADRPDELTRLSLVRARLAENLAARFSLGDKAESLFLLGLFSVLDIILEMPMEEALSMVQVSDEIREALLEGKGEFGEILKFILQYEAGDFTAVSRTLIVRDIQPLDIYNAYTDALAWYRSVIGPGD